MSDLSGRSIIMVGSLVAVACLLRLLIAVVAAANRIAREGHDGLHRSGSWRTRMVRYLLVVTPVVAMAGSLNQRTVSAQVVEQDLTIDDQCEAPRVFGPSENVRKAVLLSSAASVGLLLRLRSKRNGAMREGLEPDPKAIEVESLLQTSGDELMITRLDLAWRSLPRDAVACLRLLIVGQSSIRAEFLRPFDAERPWTQLSSRIIELADTVTLESLVMFGRASNERAPLIVPVGAVTTGEVWINLDTVRSFGIQADDDLGEKVFEGIVQSLSLSPFTQVATVVSDRPIELLGGRAIVVRDSTRSEQLASSLSTTETASVMLFDHPPTTTEVPVIYRGAIESGLDGLQSTDGGWVLQPSGVSIVPVGCTVDEIDVVKSLIGEGGPVESWPVEHWADVGRHPAIDKAVPPHTFVVSVLGSPEVRHRCGKRVDFEKSKSQELVTWLAMHPSRQRRSSARADMWSVPIKDATFSNITSDVRRSLAVADLPPADSQWLGVTLTDELPLHPEITSDVAILRACVDHARKWPEDGGIEVLRHGLSLVRGGPFETCLYIWSDSTGLASGAAVLVVRAAQMLAEMYAEVDDLDGVYWATGQGLRAVPGHEDLVALRLRLHAERGDVANLRAEWQGYCRALAHDEWGEAAPSRKMVELWRELNSAKSYPTDPVGVGHPD